MRKRLAGLSHPATVIAIIAFVLGVSGTAIAGKLITGGDVKNGTLTGADIKDGTIRPADASPALDGAQGAQGVAGPAGATGVTGPSGPSGIRGATGTPGPSGADVDYIQVSTEGPIDAVTGKEQTASCPVGSSVTGGGFVITGAAAAVVPSRSYAVDSDTWLIRAGVTSGTPDWGITVIADCAGVDLLP